jgi:hypothetical protein
VQGVARCAAAFYGSWGKQWRCCSLRLFSREGGHPSAAYPASGVDPHGLRYSAVGCRCRHVGPEGSRLQRINSHHTLLKPPCFIFTPGTSWAPAAVHGIERSQKTAGNLTGTGVSSPPCRHVNWYYVVASVGGRDGTWTASEMERRGGADRWWVSLGFLLPWSARAAAIAPSTCRDGDGPTKPAHAATASS